MVYCLANPVFIFINKQIPTESLSEGNVPPNRTKRSLKSRGGEGLRACQGSYFRASFTTEDTHARTLPRPPEETQSFVNKPVWSFIKTHANRHCWLTLQMLSKQLSGSRVTTKGLIRSHCHSLRNIRPPGGLSGSSLELSSGPIIQLAKSLVRPESDDNGNTSKGWSKNHSRNTRETETYIVLSLLFKHIHNKQVQTSHWKQFQKEAQITTTSEYKSDLTCLFTGIYSKWVSYNCCVTSFCQFLSTIKF